jgi:hypothetical protein
MKQYIIVDLARMAPPNLPVPIQAEFGEFKIIDTFFLTDSNVYPTK